MKYLEKMRLGLVYGASRYLMSAEDGTSGGGAGSAVNTAGLIAGVVRAVEAYR